MPSSVLVSNIAIHMYPALKLMQAKVLQRMKFHGWPVNYENLYIYSTCLYIVIANILIENKTFRAM